VNNLGANNGLILIILQGGKTLVSNTLAEATDSAISEYRPTQGCRIVEFELNNILMQESKTNKADVEMWDCSGDRK
jgi:Rab-like protein 5